MAELTPVTREEMYLDEIADALENGGGGGGAAVYNATITIQKNGTKVDDFTANQRTDKTINITVPTQASDINAATATQGGKADTAIQGIKVNSSTVNPDANKVVNITVPTTAADVSALPASTKYAAALSLTINSSTFVMTGQLKDQNGDNLGTAQTIDLPLESVVVNGSYNSQTKKVVLTLQNGNTIEFSVADLVSGLQTELSASNKLNPAYINYDSTHRAVSDTEKSTWNSKQSALDSTQLAAVNSGIDSTKVAQITTNENNILSLTTPKIGAITWETGWTPTSEIVSIRQYGNIVVGQIYATFTNNLPTTETAIGTITGVDKTRVHYRGIGYTAPQLYNLPTDNANVFISGNTGQLLITAGTNTDKTLRLNFVYCTSDPA